MNLRFNDLKVIYVYLILSGIGPSPLYIGDLSVVG
jgi:hypothetical protein